MRAWLLLTSTLLLTACAGRTVVAVPRPPADPNLPPLSYYEAGGAVPAARSHEIIHVERHLEIRRVLVPPRLPADLQHLSHAEDPIEILLYVPRPLGRGRHPVVVMSPVLANSTLLMNEFASGFTRQGWLAAIVMRKEFEFDPETALAQAEGEFRTYVMQSRQAIDWLVAQPYVDGARLGTFGVSAGATISASLAGADSRPVAHVLVLAGGPLADVLSETDEDRFVEYRQKLAAGSKMTEQEMRERLRATILTDPIRLAPRVKSDDVLLFVARKDTAIPTKYGLVLWEALGRPRLHMLPFGHYTSFLLLPWITNQTTRFLGAKFDRVR